MAGGVRRHGGGILGLRKLLTEHGEAIEYDVLCVGRDIADLGTCCLSWRHLWVIVHQSPVSSALRREVAGLTNGMSAVDAILADVANSERLSIWQRSGAKGRKPTLIDVFTPEDRHPFGQGVPAEEMDRRLGWRRTAHGIVRESVRSDG